jgi:hypothetical protein
MKSSRLLAVACVAWLSVYQFSSMTNPVQKHRGVSTGIAAAGDVQQYKMISTT